MFEAYLFHAMFALQIVLISVLIPRRLLQRALDAIAHSPLPLPDGGEEWVRRTAMQYRLWNGVIVVMGLLLMAWLFSYMRQPDWTDGPVEVWMGPYFVLQCLPIAVFAFRIALANKSQKNRLPVERKKALLQRRGLFDFVSPAAVALALLCYVLFVAMVFYIERNPFAGFAGQYINIGIVTFHYGLTAFLIYFFIYRRKRNPLHTHTQRMQEMEAVVRVLVYSCLAGTVALMVNFSLVLLDKQRLEPFAMSVHFVILALWIYYSMRVPPTESAPPVAHTGVTS